MRTRTSVDDSPRMRQGIGTLHRRMATAKLPVYLTKPNTRVKTVLSLLRSCWLSLLACEIEYIGCAGILPRTSRQICSKLNTEISFAFGSLQTKKKHYNAITLPGNLDGRERTSKPRSRVTRGTRLPFTVSPSFRCSHQVTRRYPGQLILAGRHDPLVVGSTNPAVSRLFSVVEARSAGRQRHGHHGGRPALR